MSEIDDLHQTQQHEVQLPSDAAFEAFLAEVSIADVLRDRLPRTAIELRHLARARTRKESAA